VAEPEVWDDRAATDVTQLVASLFVAAEPPTRVELSKQLGTGRRGWRGRVRWPGRCSVGSG
jgi:hypothetical protein